MGSDGMLDRSTSLEHVSSGEVDAETSNLNSIEAVSSGGGTTREIERAAEILTRLELYLARASEKLVNLDMLVLHVASRENYFEVFSFEDDEEAKDHAERALEFDILYGFLDSEVRELEGIFSVLQTEIVSSQEALSSFKQLDDVTKEMGDKLHDCEGSLKRCFEQVSDIKVQSANFRRILRASGDGKYEDDNEDPGLEEADLQNLSAKKMQTAEQHRNILTMLEKSLAREIDLEAKLNESRQIEESLKLQIHQEVFSMEEEAKDMWQRVFEAENSAEILLMISKELIELMQTEKNSIDGSSKKPEELQSKFQQLNEQFEELNDLGQTAEGSNLQMQTEEVEAEGMLQRLFEAENSAEVLFMISKELFGQIQTKDRTINGPSQRDDKLQSKIQQLNEQLKEKACALQSSETSRTELSVKVCLLEQKLGESVLQLKQLKDLLEQNKDFKEKASEAEKRASVAEAECKLLRGSNEELNKDVGLLKSSVDDASERLEQMEGQLMDSEIKRLHAEASAEATQEKQSLLECMIKDMDALIKDLKLKVVKAERQTESAEDKCIILSESNAELIKELNFLRHRVQNLEKSLWQAEESKKGTAKDIRVRTEFIADLVMQLALERERLRNQISSLVNEKNAAVMYLQQMKEPSVTMTADGGAEVDKSVLSEDASKNGNFRNRSNEEMMGSSAASDEATMTQEDTILTGEIKTEVPKSPTEIETMRNIDARQLNFKYIFLAVVALVIPVMVALLYHHLVIERS